MTTRRPRSSEEPNASVERMLQTLASDALDRVAAHSDRTEYVTAPVDQDVLAALCVAVCAPQPQDADAIVAGLLRRHLSPAHVVTDYLGAAARSLGDGWVKDMRSFAQVSVGTARLQTMVRDVMARMPVAAEPSPRNIAMIVRSSEQHTFGAVAATHLLRQMGHSVWIGVGLPDNIVAEQIARRGCDVVCLSVAHEHELQAMGPFAALMSKAAGPRTPVVLGGSVLERVAQSEIVLPGVTDVCGDLNEMLARHSKSALELAGRGLQ